jgi:hypothetical protein
MGFTRDSFCFKHFNLLPDMSELRAPTYANVISFKLVLLEIICRRAYFSAEIHFRSPVFDDRTHVLPILYDDDDLLSLWY